MTDKAQAYFSVLHAHIDSAVATTETATLDLTNGLSDIHRTLLASQQSGGERVDLKDLAGQISGLLAVLQFQDIVRQQLECVQCALSMAKGEPTGIFQAPEPQAVEDALEKLKRDYVMQQQIEAHNRALGHTDPDAGGADVEFF